MSTPLPEPGNLAGKDKSLRDCGTENAAFFGQAIGQVHGQAFGAQGRKSCPGFLPSPGSHRQPGKASTRSRRSLGAVRLPRFGIGRVGGMPRFGEDLPRGSGVPQRKLAPVSGHSPCDRAEQAPGCPGQGQRRLAPERLGLGNRLPQGRGEALPIDSGEPHVFRATPRGFCSR